MKRRRRLFRGLTRTLGHAVFDAAVVGAHRAYEGLTRIRADLDPRHIAHRVEAFRRQVEAEIQLASRA